MKKGNLKKNILSILSLIGLAGLFLPICRSGTVSYNMSGMLRMGKKMGLSYVVPLVLLLVLAMVAIFAIMLWESDYAYLVAAAIHIADAEILLLYQMIAVGKLLDKSSENGLHMAAIGFWAFVSIQATCGLLELIIYFYRQCTKNRNDDTFTSYTPVNREPEVGMIYIKDATRQNRKIQLADQFTYVLGGDANQCHVVIAGARVSSRHCTLTFCAGTGTYVICDYSECGTYFENGQRLPQFQNMELVQGTIICLGVRDNGIRVGR